MHYIKDIFEKGGSEHAHNKFIRYSKGEFIGPLMKAKLSKSAIKISASFHFVDELLHFIADHLKDQKVHIIGSLVWNEDLSAKLASLGIKYSKVSKSRGIFKYLIDNDVNLKEFMNLMGNYHLLLSFKHADISLTSKSSFPKPNKEFTTDFCKATFPGELVPKFLENFAFDIKKQTIKEFNLSHTIIVEDIKLPENIDDFETARRLSKRKGKLIRRISINAEPEVISECKFEV